MMTIDDYNKRKNALECEYLEKLAGLNLDWAHENKEFNVGDFIQNVTGIICVERIAIEGGESYYPTIVYVGKRYRKLHGKLISTKTRDKGRIIFNAKKINNPIVDEVPLKYAKNYEKNRAT